MFATPTVHPAAPHLIDLSHPLVHGAETFPNDPKLAIISHAKIATHQYNTTHVLIGSHQGTHLDAMSHFFAEGRTVDQMPLEWFYGPATVIHLPKEPDAEITRHELESHSARIVRGGRVMINTGWYRRFGTPEYFTRFPSFTIEAAQYLASRGIRMLGMDMPSLGKQWLELHHVLLCPSAEVVVVESLTNLDVLPPDFIFAGFPLPLQGRDGSPIRAVAIC